MGYSGFEKHGINSELCIKERLVAVNLHEEVDASMALVEMRVFVGEGLWTTRAAECPSRCNLK